MSNKLNKLKKGEWLILGRDKYQLDALEEDLINENGVVGIRKYEWKSPITPVGTPDGTNIPYLQTWDENQLTWTAYMVNDNEVQYIWNKTTLVWETV